MKTKVFYTVTKAEAEGLVDSHKLWGWKLDGVITLCADGKWKVVLIKG